MKPKIVCVKVMLLYVVVQSLDMLRESQDKFLANALDINFGMFCLCLFQINKLSYLSLIMMLNMREQLGFQ